MNADYSAYTDNDDKSNVWQRYKQYILICIVWLICIGVFVVCILAVAAIVVFSYILSGYSGGPLMIPYLLTGIWVIVMAVLALEHCLAILILGIRLHKSFLFVTTGAIWCAFAAIGCSIVVLFIPDVRPFMPLVLPFILSFSMMALFTIENDETRPRYSEKVKAQTSWVHLMFLKTVTFSLYLIVTLLIGLYLTVGYYLPIAIAVSMFVLAHTFNLMESPVRHKYILTEREMIARDASIRQVAEDREEQEEQLNAELEKDVDNTSVDIISEMTSPADTVSIASNIFDTGLSQQDDSNIFRRGRRRPIATSNSTFRNSSRLTRRSSLFFSIDLTKNSFRKKFSSASTTDALLNDNSTSHYYEYVHAGGTMKHKIIKYALMAVLSLSVTLLTLLLSHGLFYIIAGIRFRSTKPEIIGYRGHSRSSGIPENSLIAFQYAVNNSLDSVIIDVQLTKDNELIVIHDATVDRTTNGTGHVSELTYLQLQSLVLKSKKVAYQNERVPLLEQVLEVISNSSVDAIIEFRWPYLYRDKNIELQVLQLVEDMNMVNRTRYQSYDPISLITLQSFNNYTTPSVIRRYTMGPQTYIPSIPYSTSTVATSGISFFLNPWVVFQAHRENYKYFVWFDGSERSRYVKSIARSGIDGIFVNN
jgi:glycerophosphoryl diester phosphodiesterase